MECGVACSIQKSIQLLILKCGKKASMHVIAYCCPAIIYIQDRQWDAAHLFWSDSNHLGVILGHCPASHPHRDCHLEAMMLISYTSDDIWMCPLSLPFPDIMASTDLNYSKNLVKLLSNAVILSCTNTLLHFFICSHLLYEFDDCWC